MALSLWLKQFIFQIAEKTNQKTVRSLLTNQRLSHHKSLTLQNGKWSKLVSLKFIPYLSHYLVSTQEIPSMKIWNELQIISVTLSVFPGVCASIQSSSDDEFSQKWFSPILTMLLYNFGDTLGRLATAMIQINKRAVSFGVFENLASIFLAENLHLNEHKVQKRLWQLWQPCE